MEDPLITNDKEFSDILTKFATWNEGGQVWHVWSWKLTLVGSSKHPNRTYIKQSGTTTQNANSLIEHTF